MPSIKISFEVFTGALGYKLWQSKATTDGVGTGEPVADKRGGSASPGLEGGFSAGGGAVRGSDLRSQVLLG